MVLLSKSAVLLMLLLTAQCQDLNNEVRTGEAGEDKRRDQLRWFPADSETDCQVQPGPEQVETDLSLMSCSSCAGEGGEAQQGLQGGRGEVLSVWQGWQSYQAVKHVEISLRNLQDIIQAGQEEGGSLHRHQTEGRQRQNHAEKEIVVISSLIIQYVKKTTNDKRNMIRRCKQYDKRNKSQ